MLLVRSPLLEGVPVRLQNANTLMPGTAQEKTRLDAEALRKHEERAHWEWVPVAAAADTRQQEEFAAAGVNLTAAQLRAQLARCVER